MLYSATELGNATPFCSVELLGSYYVLLQEWKLDTLQGPFWRLYVPFEPGGIVGWGDTETPLVPGNGMLIPPRTEFSTRNDRHFRKAYTHFDCKLSGVVPVPGVYVFPLPNGSLEEVRRAAEAVKEKQPRAEANLDLWILRLISAGLLDLPPAAWQSGPTLSAPIRDVIRQMRNHLDRPINNTQLAAFSGIHPNSFVRLFTREVGLSPQRYAMQLRLEEAARLLAGSNRSIETIADACGFRDRYHFSRAFSGHWNCPPAAFRKRNRVIVKNDL